MALKKIIPFLLVILAACSGSKKELSEQTKPRLLVSIAPYQTIVQKIAGDEFEVIAVVPPNANPHSYEPTSRQVAELKDGAVWFQIGEPFEQKLSPLLKKTQLVDLRRLVSMIDSEPHHCEACGHDHLDRHIWLSPKQAALQADQIGEILSERYPEKTPAIHERLSVLKTELNALDQDIAKILDHAEARTFLVSHPAFAYFCRDYGLHQLSVEYEGKDPRPKDLENIYQSALETQTEIAIALPQHNNKGAQLIAKKLHIPIRMVDPYSAQYFETMRTLANFIADPYAQDE